MYYIKEKYTITKEEYLENLEGDSSFLNNDISAIKKIKESVKHNKKGLISFSGCLNLYMGNLEWIFKDVYEISTYKAIEKPNTVVYSYATDKEIKLYELHIKLNEI